MNQKFQMVNPHFPLFGTLCSRVHRTNRVTRNSMNFHIPYFRIKLVSRLPKWCIPDIWNSFETIEIKAQTSRNLFNKKLKKQLLNELVVECNRLSCQECT